MEKRIIKLVEEKGPLTGAEIHAVIKEDPLRLWRTCRTSNGLAIRIAGTRYLRLDRKINGFARLSPSILREFLTYSLVGLPGDSASLARRTNEILMHAEAVSRSKLNVAYSIVSTLAGRIGDEQLLEEQACFIIAGDIVYNMAHDVPRPERSTGKLVKGSDMDIVVIVDAKFPKKMIKRLDDEIYREKYNLLINPHQREELDYIVKDLEKVRKQLSCDKFRRMVACKIMQEGRFLYGSRKIFSNIKSMLSENGVIEKLIEMENSAKEFRRKGEEYLMEEGPSGLKKESLNLFYPSEESEEFE